MTARRMPAELRGAMDIIICTSREKGEEGGVGGWGPRPTGASPCPAAAACYRSTRAEPRRAGDKRTAPLGGC